MQPMLRQSEHLVRPIATLLVALVLMGSAVATAPAQTGLMRQLGAVQGEVAGEQAWTNLTLPETVQDRAVLAAARQVEDVPYQFEPVPTEEAFASQSGLMPPGPQAPLGFDHELEDSWHDFLPRGCWPWGGRTPNHLRHRHVCWPLEGTSWRNRPLSAGWAVGGFWGDDPLDNLVSLDPGIYGAYRLGWDYDHYFGLEARLAQATPGISTDTDVPSTTADVTLFDVSMLWYPTGDSRLRPYFLAGLGFQYLNFRDHNYRVTEDAVFSMPLGIGVKWMCSPWLALRMEFSENFAVGSPELDMMHNLTLNGGVEVRFGGTRPSYWPYNTSKYLW